MKINRYLTIAAILLTSSLSAFAKDNDKIPGATVQDASFFTGKPYDADLEAYVFNYRNFNTEAGRWTTSDPSGFPDGANNQFYAPVPTRCVDPTGLLSISGQATPNLNTHTTTYAGRDYTITATTAQSIDADSFKMTFPGYTFSPREWGGTLNIDNYSVNVEGGTGSVPINVSTSGTAATHWIQIVTTNSPLDGQVSGSPFFDNAGGSTPFYDDVATAGHDYFYDVPRRSLSMATPSVPVRWAADLYFVHALSTSVSIYGGFHYSWEISVE